MNLKEQVLSIDQVRELQELGFDVEKYASMCWIGVEDKYRLTIFDTWCLEKTCLGTIPTLTIGDIMECLPKNIKFEGWEYDVSIYRNQISYYDRNIDEDIFVSKAGLSLIDALFETIVWCIKNKYIAL